MVVLNAQLFGLAFSLADCVSYVVLVASRTQRRVDRADERSRPDGPFDDDHALVSGDRTELQSLARAFTCEHEHRECGPRRLLAQCSLEEAIGVCDEDLIGEEQRASADPKLSAQRRQIGARCASDARVAEELHGVFGVALVRHRDEDAVLERRVTNAHDLTGRGLGASYWGTPVRTPRNCRSGSPTV